MGLSDDSIAKAGVHPHPVYFCGFHARFGQELHLAVSTAAEIEAGFASSACPTDSSIGGFRSGLDVAALPCKQCQSCQQTPNSIGQ